MSSHIKRQLAHARSLIERRELWASNAAELDGTRHCAVTAMGDGAFGLARAFCEANGLSTGDLFASVIRYNDSHTHEEVLAAMDRAIAAAR